MSQSCSLASLLQPQRLRGTPRLPCRQRGAMIPEKDAGDALPKFRRSRVQRASLGFLPASTACPSACLSPPLLVPGDNYAETEKLLERIMLLLNFCQPNIIILPFSPLFSLTTSCWEGCSAREGQATESAASPSRQCSPSEVLLAQQSNQVAYEFHTRHRKLLSPFLDIFRYLLFCLWER